MDLGISGLASGFDWRSLVDQLLEVERAPQTTLRAEQDTIETRNNAYGSLKTELQVLRSRLDVLRETGFFSSRTTQSSDASLAEAEAESGAVQGSYNLNVSQLATAAHQDGTNNIGAALSASGDLSGIEVASAPLATAIRAGNFTVNGKQITVATTDTLQAVLNRISEVTGSSVAATYDPSTDKVTLSSSGPIILGSATDSSNFLRALKLANNGTGTITSSTALGSAQLKSSLSSANFSSTISDGGSGAGQFVINGVAINFSATADSLQNVIDRINASAAGVVASYDAVNDRFVLANKITGDLGIALEDVAGNFLAATGLTAGTLSRGNDLIYTIGDGGQLTSPSNTIDAESSGIPGLSITVKAPGQVTITVGSDTEKIKAAIIDFVTQYNKVQGLIDTQTTSSTDAKGKVSSGVLADDTDADEIASRLRSILGFRTQEGVYRGVEDLGIVSGGYDNNLSLSDTTKLETALATGLTDVERLFANESSGLANRLDDYLEGVIGEDGSLVNKQGALTKQAGDIDTQIADMERLVLEQRDRLIASFLAMETAQAKINQQMQFLNQKFGTTT